MIKNTKKVLFSLVSVAFVLLAQALPVNAANFTTVGPTNQAVFGSPSISNITRGGKYDLTASGLPGNGNFGNSQSGVPTVYVNNVAQQTFWSSASNKVGFLVNIAGNWTAGESVGVYVGTSTGLTSTPFQNITAQSDPGLY